MSEDSEAQTTEFGKKPEASGRTLPFVLLIVVCTVYLIGLAILVMHSAPCVPGWWGPLTPPEGLMATHFSCRTPNELGDFLAGAFAPLAFLLFAGAVWLQTIELREQRIQLKLQYEEYKLSRKELALTREEMVEMRRVAIAQADEARASKEFIGKQTEIMQKQFERETLEDLHEELETLASTINTCLDRFYVTWAHYERNGACTTETIKVKTTLELAEKSQYLRKAIINNEPSIAALQKAGKVGTIPGRVFHFEDLYNAMNQLRDMTPRLGHRSKARFVELGLEAVIRNLIESFGKLRSMGFDLPDPR
ncbi:hypothetical protein ABWH89_05100 [Hoeflea alexandrii]|uniref:hypothetical protein n=1 Tax=Hoeflea alexandrii TaxID=288436 RepID=UPI0035D13587